MGAFAFSVWSINILFMVGAGWQLAHAYTTSDTGLTGTHAVFIYDMLHPMGLAAERLATFMLGLVAYMFGWAIRNGAIWPKWLAWAAWSVAAVAGVVAVAFSEYSPFMYYAQALFVVWLAASAVVMLAERRQPQPGR
jgi:peptidoglycan/LPS O-acetylase OafA/YrhL